MLTVGSLFSGIGGLDLGLERAGMNVSWQCEKDTYARKVLKKHWPTIPCYFDVRDVRVTCHRGCFCCPDVVDLICGGFPCQDISVAGKGAGIKEGTRSGLWIEFARIIRELRPRYVLVENVPALRSRGLDRVLGDLATLGYNAEWDCIPAAALGAPHRRDRIFVVAYAQQQQLRQQPRGRSRQDGQGPLLAPEHGAQRDVANADASRELQQSRRIFQVGQRLGDCDWWRAEPDVARVVHGLPRRVDRERVLGNAVVPQAAEYVGRRILEFDANSSKLRTEAQT